MLLHHLRYTFRVLRRAPAFTTVAVLTLALGIGANTAVFSVVDAVMLRPLPYPESARLISLWEVNERRHSRLTVSPANLVDYQRANRTFDDLAGFASVSAVLTKRERPNNCSAKLSPGTCSLCFACRQHSVDRFFPRRIAPGVRAW